jgi:23S rRNA pseudouridine1911/1915/1917 synthase
VEKKIDLAVDLKEINSRLDVFLARRLGVSRSFAARLVDNGHVLVDGERKRPSLKLKMDSRISVAYEAQEQDLSIRPCSQPLDILYQDECMVVLNKPAGLVVHPGAGNTDRTLVHALLALYPEISGVGEAARPGVVHRLDKLTSGVMVVARNRDAHAALSLAFKAHAQAREYLAVCYGHLPEMRGSIVTFMKRHPGDRKRMTSRAEEGRRAVTHYQVLREWRDFSLVQLRLETGRTHQIRVHLSDMGHPVAGDAQYGGKRRANTIRDREVMTHIQGLQRQMLHASLLGLRHPATGEWMEFKAEMPHDMKELIELLDERE